MREHLKRVHPKQLPQENGPSGDQPTLANLIVVKKRRTCNTATSQETTAKILSWLVNSLRPLSTLDDTGFHQLFDFLSPEYVVPSRTHLTKLIKTRHSLGLKQLSKVLDSAVACCLTTDAWTIKATQSYNTVTAHYVDENWSLVSVVVETTMFPGSHTGERIAEKIMECVDRIALGRDQVLAVVHDEARNAEAAGEILFEKK